MTEIIATSLNQLVANARLQAQMGYFDGTELTGQYLAQCRQIFLPMKAIVIFTRDVGHHSSGWWKNPDYERCYHLSVSFPNGFTKRRGEVLAKAFFGSDTKLLWIEPPYSAHGKQHEVWHYRLFCNEAWEPIKPSGEVYTPRMPKGWMSFSERHGNKKKRGN